MLHSLREATNAIKNGEVVCIFAEGQITRIGQLLPFRRGMERIMKGVDAPIVPVNLDGVWGSIFSFERGRFLWKLPRSIPYPVTVSFGKPMPPTATPLRSAPRGAGICRPRRIATTRARMRTLHRSLDPHRASPSVPLRDGRQAPPAHEMGRRAAERDFSGAPAAQPRGQARKWSASCCRRRSRRARELRGHARRENPGEFELHVVGRIARFVRRAMQAGNRHHHEAAAR